MLACIAVDTGTAHGCLPLSYQNCKQSRAAKLHLVPLELEPHRFLLSCSRDEQAATQLDNSTACRISDWLLPGKFDFKANQPFLILLLLIISRSLLISLLTTGRLLMYTPSKLHLFLPGEKLPPLIEFPSKTWTRLQPDGQNDHNPSLLQQIPARCGHAFQCVSTCAPL